MRFAEVAGGVVTATRLGPGTWVVRNHPGGRVAYDLIVTVRVTRLGRRLHLSGMMAQDGSTVSRRWLLGVRGWFFPRARVVVFERMRQLGVLEPHVVRLPRG